MRLIDANIALQRFIEEAEYSEKRVMHINTIKRILQDIDSIDSSSPELQSITIDHSNNYEQVVFERDIAISQLEEIGCSLGKKMDDIKEAIEKQKSKKVIPTPDNDYYSFKCPVCNKHYAWSIRHTYCDCGQKLDWNDLSKVIYDDIIKSKNGE